MRLSYLPFFYWKKAIFRASQNELRLEQRLERASLFRSAKAFRIMWFKRQSELSERAWENAVQSWAGHQDPVVRRPISAWPRVRFNPGFFFFCSKTFSWIIFSVIFKSIQSSTCWQKELNWIYFSSFHLGYLNPALNNPAQMGCGWGPTWGMIINRKKNWQFITQIKLHTHLLNL